MDLKEKYNVFSLEGALLSAFDGLCAVALCEGGVSDCGRCGEARVDFATYYGLVLEGVKTIAQDVMEMV